MNRNLVIGVVILMVLSAVAGAVLHDYRTDDDEKEKGNQAPIAVALSDKTTVYFNETITFDASNSSDPEGKELTITWYLGDGTGKQNGTIVTHRYAEMGTYHVVLIVSDGELEDSDDLVILVTTREGSLRINEVMFNPQGSDDGNEWVEIVNTAETPLDLEGWTISDGGGGIKATLPEWTLPPDSFLVISLGSGPDDDDFSDGTGMFHTGGTTAIFINAQDECGLYNGTPSAENITDFVSWSFDDMYTSGQAHEYAVEKGIWTQGDHFAYCSYCEEDEGCIGRDRDSTDTDQSEDWFRDGGTNARGPTPGKDNDALNIYDRSITGNVRDQDGNPVSGVRVKLPGTSNEVFTDAHGEYYLLNAPIGEIPVVYTKEGYVINTRIVPVSNHGRSFYDVVLVKEQQEFQVTPGGGTFQGEEGVVMEIPEGAFDQAVNLSATSIPLQAYPETSDRRNDSIVLGCVHLGPSNVQMMKPLNVTIPITYADEEILNVIQQSVEFSYDYLNETTLTWEEGGGAALDPGGASVTISVTHFSVMTVRTPNGNISIQVKDWGYKDGDKQYEGNAYCGGTFKKIIKRTTQVGYFDYGMDPEMVKRFGKLFDFSVGGKPYEKKDVGGETHTFKAGPCEELNIWSQIKYKVWSVQVFNLIDTPEKKTEFKGKVEYHVPHGLRVYFTRIDRTKECCPTKSSHSRISYTRIEDETGAEITNLNLNVGDSLTFSASGYDNDSNNIGPVHVIWSLTGSLPPPVSSIGPTFTFTPLSEGSGTITIDDGNGHTTSTGTITIGEREDSLKINEIMYDPFGGDSGKEWVELYNQGPGPIDIGGWTLSNRNGVAVATLPDWDLPEDTYLSVHFGTGTDDDDFSDGTASYFTGTIADVFDNFEDECALYQGNPSVLNITDFISWSHDEAYVPGQAHDLATDGGIWDPGNHYQLCTPCGFEGESIGRDSASTDSDLPEDWYGGGGVNAQEPTPGKDNDAFNIYDRSISGIVVDGNGDGNPLAGVKVNIQGTTIEAFSDGNGEYYLIGGPAEEIPLGEIPVMFSKDGYVPNTRIVPVSNHEKSSYGAMLVPLEEGTPIGTGGGTITTPEGIVLEIPAGALNETVNITITPIPPPSLAEIDGPDYSLTLNALEFGPSGLTFNKPVNVTIPFTYIETLLDEYPMKVENASLRFSYLDLDTMGWEDLGSAVMNSGNTSATIQLDHFSRVRTTSLGYWWDIKLTDQGFYYGSDEKSLVGIVPCGKTLTVTYSKSHSVTVSGELGVSFEGIGAKLGISITDTVQVTQSLPVTAGKCEEILVYGYPTYKKWKAEIWYAGRWRLFTHAGWKKYGDATIWVPQPGVKWEFKKIDRTEECCPKKVVSKPVTDSIRIEDTDGNVLSDAYLKQGESYTLVAMGYDATGSAIGPISTIWDSTGTLSPPVSYIGGTYTFTPDIEGSGTITIDDGRGHTASTGTITTLPLDTTHPGILETNPEDNELNVSIGSAIHILFDEPIDMASMGDAITIDPVTTFTLYWDETGASLILLPDEEMVFDTTYTITLGTQLADRSGNHLELPYEFTFTTEPDSIMYPEVTSTDPFDTQIDVSEDTEISITFSVAMDQDSVNAILFDPDTPFGWRWEEGDTRLVLVPQEQLKYNSTYTVTVDTSVMDTHGNHLQEIYDFSFTITPDTTPPTVDGTDPFDGQGEVPVDSVIKIFFSEAMDPASVDIAFSTTPHFEYEYFWNPETTAITIDPESPLNPGTTYFVTVSTEAMDQSGNHLEEAYEFSFTTE